MPLKRQSKKKGQPYVPIDSSNKDRLLGAIIDVLKLLLASCGEDVDGEGRRLYDWLSSAKSNIVQPLTLCNSKEGSANQRCHARHYKLLTIMQESLLLHRWADAMHVLKTLTATAPLSYGRTVLHVVLELCWQLHLNPDQMLNQLSSGYGELTDSAVAVESFCYSAMSKRILSDCHRAIRPSVVCPRRSFSAHAQAAEERDRLMQRLYAGLLSYVEYRRCKLALNDVAGTFEADDITRQMNIFADDAIAQWEGIELEPGVWDVFVVKYVELLEHQGHLEKCEKVLNSYRQTCVVKCNPLRLLYCFYQRHGLLSTTQSIDLLKELCSMDDSDEMVLALHRMLSADDRTAADRLALLFNFLDYSSSRSNCKAWKLLSRELKKIADGGHVDAGCALQKCWQDRAEWWPQYHFNVFSLPSEDRVDVLTDPVQFDLIALKASCAYLLLGGDNWFTQTAIHVLSSVSAGGVCRKSFLKLLKLSVPSVD